MAEEPTQITASVPLDGSGKPSAGEGNGAPLGADGKPVANGGTPENAKPNGDGAPNGDAKGEEGKAPEAPVNPNELTKKPAIEKPLGDSKTPEQENAEKATGLDLTKYANEYSETGKLSDASYAELAAKGFPKDVADTYMDGVKARVQTRLTNLAGAVGGVDTYNSIMTWGKTNLSDAEKAEAVKILSGGSEESAKIFLAGLQSRFSKANGSAPSKIAGGGGAPSADVYASREEQKMAMRDPRYKTDAKYRDEVTQKSIRSFSQKGARARTKSRSKKAATHSRRRRSKARS